MTSSRRVCLARDRCFPANADESLLAAGRRAGYAFPQACRNGTCYRCEGWLLAGEVVHQRTAERLRAGDSPVPVLPCVVAALTDCDLSVAGVYGPGELPVLTVAAQVVAVVDLAANIACVRLRLPAGRKVERLAGQYLEIIDGDNAYAFSIASAPASGRELELHVRHGEDNPSSLLVMALLRREPVVSVRLPLGGCTLVGEPRLPLLLVAGATGFSQVKAFAEHAIAGGWRVPISLYWGARTPDELYLAALPAGWARDHDNIRFVPVVSAATPGDGQRAGLVHEAVLADGHDLTAALAYVCGSPAMVYAVHDALVANGMPSDRVFSDVFAWAPRPAA